MQVAYWFFLSRRGEATRSPANCVPVCAHASSIGIACSQRRENSIGRANLQTRGLSTVSSGNDFLVNKAARHNGVDHGLVAFNEAPLYRPLRLITVSDPCVTAVALVAGCKYRLGYSRYESHLGFDRCDIDLSIASTSASRASNLRSNGKAREGSLSHGNTRKRKPGVRNSTLQTEVFAI